MSPAALILFLGGRLVLSSPLFFHGKAPDKESGRGELARLPAGGTEEEEEEDDGFRPRGEEGRLSFKELKFGPQK